MAGESKIWAVRCPGGPTKIMRSESPMTEQFVKDHYLESFNYRRATFLDDPDTPWPLIKPIDETEMQRDYGQFLGESSITGRPRSLVEI